MPKFFCLILSNVQVECDLWPEITYAGEKGYKGLKVSVPKAAFDDSKFEQVKYTTLICLSYDLVR